ncbi:MAG: LacI family transcriptional regulator, repressor for deo operon, udp, cdd, tsx, nupC, and nupG [Thermotogota bacterium]|nr:LacI family transcriptional regulator, repressor for deo operon, udp, cdd, tsx, nupC, and nupG [Thermotogota bacterium]
MFVEVVFLKLTISQIARLAGVSKSTVSRALNGSGYVSEVTRRKIQDIIRKYDYVPDSKAVSLSKRRTFTIGLVLPSTSGPFYGEVIRGVEEVLSSRGYFTLLTVLDSGQDEVRARKRYLSAIRERRVDGAIIFDPTIDEETVNKLSRCRMPIIFLLKDFQALGIDSVVVDNFSGSVSMVNHLVEKHGYRCIAFIRGPEVSDDSEERFQGFVESLKRHGISCDDLPVFVSNFTFEGGRRIYKELRKFLHRLDAVFCANDEMALGIMEEMKKDGYKPGIDVAVVGFDDAFWAGHIEPPLTTVHQPMYEVGKISAERILDRVESPDVFKDPVKITLRTRLVVRKSCGC